LIAPAVLADKDEQLMDTVTGVAQAVERLKGMFIEVERMKGMFLEVPGTRLSIDEAARLTGVEQATCRIILKALEEARFLKCRPDGLFMRASD
jgi:Fic family protein